MKLRCRINDKYLNKILSGEKEVEYRQVESIVFECDGKEYEFVVDRLFEGPPIDCLQRLHPDVNWKENLPSMGIWLGQRIR